MPPKKVIDDEEVIVKKPKKVVAGDDEEVVVKKPKKAAAADDEEVVVKKPKKSAAADDEEVVVKKSKKTAAAADASTGDAPAAAAPAPRRAANNEALMAAQLNATWVAPDYDNMTFEQFQNLLETLPMSISLAQKTNFDSQQALRESDDAKSQVEAFLDGTTGGTQYNTMLSRAAKIIKESGIGNSSSRGIEIPPPQMEKSGSKRIIIANFAAICAAIGRSNITEVQKYFERQTSATTSLDGNGALILKMKLDAKGVERIFDKFLSEWVVCDVCKSMDTQTSKENRLYVIRCNTCKAFRYAEMTDAYAANTTKRSKLRSAGML